MPFRTANVAGFTKTVTVLQVAEAFAIGLHSNFAGDDNVEAIIDLALTDDIFVAAIIEGFWSALPLPPMVKYSAAATLWIAVIGYLGFAGRELRERLS